MNNIKSPKKLIEVALPLDDINAAAAKEKSIRQGHPSTLHLWWARRPLAAARAVIFAQMVNDPGGERGYYAGKTKMQADLEREELFNIIRDLVKWENVNNEAVLDRARKAIRRSWEEVCELNKGKEGFNSDKLPAFHDPFAGGGAIPLEAQRLGLESFASDLNPVAVMINKAMIEIPPKFAGRTPIGPILKNKNKPKLTEDWSGANGLAEDVSRYGQWMRDEANKRIGHLYPKILITEKMIKERPDLKIYLGDKLTIIAWIWARTVKSPNPVYNHVDVPLISSYILSSKKGKEAWLEPKIIKDNYSFKVRIGEPPPEAKTGTKAGRGGNFKCIMSDTPIPVTAIREQGKASTMNQRLIAVVAEGKKGRIYLSASKEMEPITDSLAPSWKPTSSINHNPRDIRTQLYGLNEYSDLFTSRQLVALSTLSDLIFEVRNRAIEDAKSSGMADDELGIDSGGIGATAYGDAISTYLTLALGKASDYNSSLCSWISGGQTMRNTFGRQAIPMVWDFAEANILGNSTGCFLSGVGQIHKVIQNFPARLSGTVSQSDAARQVISNHKVISTDPPYYDNIGYADLSDFFYVWMRHSLKSIYPSLFATLAVPKAEELVATPYRHGSKEKAEYFFMDGMTQAMHNLAKQSHSAFPVTIYYAFKQSETKDSGTMSTGWETFLAAVITAGFTITGTWPMRTEMANRMVGAGANVLASSIVLVCRTRDSNALNISRREFQRELKEEMPKSLEAMIGGREGASPIAPVDLAQAAIGPGIGIFSKYSAVLNQDGSNTSVHDALIMINKAIDEYFSDAEGELDEDSRFCVDWFMQYGFGRGVFGEADTLARAKGTSVDLVKDAGVIESGQGKVKLFKWEEYPIDWDPTKDNRTPVWEACHHMIRVLNQKGEGDAGALLAKMPQRTEPIRQLAYRLYTLCERKGWADEARAYNELISSWHAIVEASYEVGRHGEQQTIDF